MAVLYPTTTLLSRLPTLNEDALRRELAELLARQKLDLNWEHSVVERDRAFNAEVVLPRHVPELSHKLAQGLSRRSFRYPQEHGQTPLNLQQCIRVDAPEGWHYLVAPHRHSLVHHHL